MPADALKIVHIIATPTRNSSNNNNNTNNNNDNNGNNDNSSSDEEETVSRISTASSIGSIKNYIPPRVIKNDDILFAQPTLSEKLFRYMVIFIYLGGLGSLGFFLSIYYIFFWDSRMPPVFKPTKKPPIFIKP